MFILFIQIIQFDFVHFGFYCPPKNGIHLAEMGYKSVIISTFLVATQPLLNILTELVHPFVRPSGGPMVNNAFWFWLVRSDSWSSIRPGFDAVFCFMQ